MLSPDPLGGDVTNPQSLNRYAYVVNNPTTLVDPLGLECQGTDAPAPGSFVGCASYGYNASPYGSPRQVTAPVGQPSQGYTVFDAVAGRPTPQAQYEARVTNAFLAKKGIQVGPDGTIWVFQPASTVCATGAGCSSTPAGWGQLGSLDRETQAVVTLQLSAMMTGGVPNAALIGTGVLVAFPYAATGAAASWQAVGGAAGLYVTTTNVAVSATLATEYPWRLPPKGTPPSGWLGYVLGLLHHWFGD